LLGNNVSDGSTRATLRSQRVRLNGSSRNAAMSASERPTVTSEVKRMLGFHGHARR